MEVLIGASWLLFWALVKLFTIDVMNAALVTAVIFIIVGLLFSYRPWVHRA